MATSTMPVLLLEANFAAEDWRRGQHDSGKDEDIP